MQGYLMLYMQSYQKREMQSHCYVSNPALALRLINEWNTKDPEWKYWIPPELQPINLNAKLTEVPLLEGLFQTTGAADAPISFIFDYNPETTNGSE